MAKRKRKRRKPAKRRKRKAPARDGIGKALPWVLAAGGGAVALLALTRKAEAVPEMKIMPITPAIPPPPGIIAAAMKELPALKTAIYRPEMLDTVEKIARSFEWVKEAHFTGQIRDPRKVLRHILDFETALMNLEFKGVGTPQERSLLMARLEAYADDLQKKIEAVEAATMALSF